MKILVVDDEKVLVKGIKFNLESEGYQVEAGYDGEEAVELARSRADIIITTGGLGPTLDDLTKETLATVFGKKMVLHQPSMDRLTDFFKTIGREMTKNNEKQAWLPRAAPCSPISGARRPAAPLRPTASTFSCCPVLRASATRCGRNVQCRICTNWQAAASYPATSAYSASVRATWRISCMT